MILINISESPIEIDGILVPSRCRVNIEPTFRIPDHLEESVIIINGELNL